MYRKGNTATLLVGMSIDAVTVENNMEVSQKLKLELTYDPAIVLLNILYIYIYIYIYICMKTLKKDACTPMFIAALFTIAKIWK